MAFEDDTLSYAISAGDTAWLASDDAVAILMGALAICVLVVLLTIPLILRRLHVSALARQAMAMLDAEPGARLLLSADGQVLHANTAGRLLWGDHAPLAILSQRVVSDDAALAALERLRLAAEAGVAERVELPLLPVVQTLHGAGDEQALHEEQIASEWWAISLRPLPSTDQGQRGTTLWQAEDVTARRAIEDILVREREDLAEFLYFIPAGLYSVDADGTLLMVNQRFAEWLGHSQDDLLGHRLEQFLDRCQAPDAEGAWQGTLTFRSASGHSFSALVVQTIYDDGGELRTRSVVVRPDADSNGISLPDGFADGLPDRRFRWLFEGAPVGLCLLDFDGLITDCNPAFERMCGLRRDGLLDHPLSHLIAADDRHDLEVLMQRVSLGEAAGAHREVRLVHSPDAAAALWVGPMGSGNGVDALVAYFIDTTAQRNLEAQFAQAQKMQAMGQLAGGVAHDFNNLLTAMIGFCDLLLQRHGAGDPSFADIMQIKQNSNRAANLVRQLLAFSRKQPLKPRLLDITDALTEMSHLLRRLLGESVELHMTHGRDVGLIRVDPGQFDQVIINLAVNARDAMPGGGRLSIRTGSEELKETLARGAEHVPPGSYTVVSVSDTGTGIPRENLGRIFEPFFSTKTGQVGAGTGLGLSTVYGITRQTGGFIFVDSVPNKGTTFTIYLPRQTADDGESPQKSERPAATTSGKKPSAEPDLTGGGVVLLVEDEDAVRVFAARALRNKGYTVLEARTGEGALDVLEETPKVDLLVTDMVMPGMDGATLARLVRQERPGLRVVLISGYSEEAARGELTDSPDFHFLPKPFSLNQLAAKVKEVISETQPCE